MPTLSSLYLLTKFKNNSKKKSTIIEFHEDKPPYKRKPLSLALQDALEPLCLNIKSNSDKENDVMSSISSSDSNSSNSENTSDNILDLNRRQSSAVSNE